MGEGGDRIIRINDSQLSMFASAGSVEKVIGPGGQGGKKWQTVQREREKQRQKSRGGRGLGRQPSRGTGRDCSVGSSRCQVEASCLLALDYSSVIDSIRKKVSHAHGRSWPSACWGLFSNTVPLDPNGQREVQTG